MKYLVVELNSGLVEGYYVNFEEADSYVKRYQNKFKDRNFTIDAIEDPTPLKQEDLFKFSDWFNRRNNA